MPLRSWDAKTSPPWHIAMPSGGASTPSFVSGRRQTPPDLVGKCLAELERPLPHALMADDDAACGQHLLDHAQAEREAKVQPYGVADDLGREAVPGIAGGDRRCHPVWLRHLARHGKPPTSQCLRNYLMPLADKIMLRKRFVIETVLDTLKSEMGLEHSRHRSPVNAMVH